MIDPRRKKSSGRRMGAQHSGWNVRVDFVALFNKVFHRKDKKEEIDNESADATSTTKGTTTTGSTISHGRGGFKLGRKSD
jgi:hypothetical protein